MTISLKADVKRTGYLPTKVQPRHTTQQFEGYEVLVLVPISVRMAHCGYLFGL